jgi:hypothetical protein
LNEDELDGLKEQTYAVNQIGKIAVWVHRKSEPFKAEHKLLEREQLANNYDVAVHEKALKGEAKSHGTTLVSP